MISKLHPNEQVGTEMATLSILRAAADYVISQLQQSQLSRQQKQHLMMISSCSTQSNYSALCQTQLQDLFAGRLSRQELSLVYVKGDFDAFFSAFIFSHHHISLSFSVFSISTQQRVSTNAKAATQECVFNNGKVDHTHYKYRCWLC